jgi:hypothetical protein
LSELDRSIAASVARGEAAIARQEAATAELRAISARMGGRLERADEDRGDIKALIQATRASNRALIQDARASNRALIQDARSSNREMIAEMRADRERREADEKKLDKKLDKQFEAEDKKLGVIIAELRQGRDERRAMIEGLMRMIDRLPPPAATS